MNKKMKMFVLGLLASTITATLASCSSDDDNQVQSYPLTINFTPADGLEAADISNVKVIVSGTAGNDTIAMNTLETTTLTKVQGQYKITVTGKVTDEAAAYVNGTASVDLYAEQNVNVNLAKRIESPLVFKTLYTTAGAQYYMLDGYFEIVNNSDEVQYLDQLVIAAPTGNAKQANAWQANGFTDLYESGQGAVIAFPGSGKDYPLQPGAFVVIANEAMNHTLAYGDDESKREEYAKSPNLADADWEIYLNTGDADNPDVPNLEVIFTNNKYMKAFGLGVMGRSYVLAKLPEGISPKAFAADEKNIQTTPGSSSSMTYLMIPSKYVLDAVDLYNPNTETADHYPTFLPKDDATGIQCSGSYQGKCVRRKASKIENGRVYYQDTNNSAADFRNNQDNTPRFVPTAVD